MPEVDLSTPASTYGRPKSLDRSVATVFPASHQVIVTTARGVYAWTSTGVEELFHSGSGGIIAATTASDNKELIAVADRQVVVLHDVKNGMRQSYRLKGADGRLRILKYQKASGCLFFTTTLQNAVQSYSIHEARILQSAQTHPSPPTVFAISPEPCLILSASSCPQTIYLQRLDLQGRPSLITPSMTAAAVAAATFHLQKPSILALGFVDGSIAVYDSSYLSHPDRGHQCVVEIANTKNVHTLVTETAPTQLSRDSVINGFDSATSGTSVGNQGISISSIAFVPDSECTIISVGADGRCCIIDFVSKPAYVSGWSVGGFATSLSVVRISPGVSTTDSTHRGGSSSESASEIYNAHEVLVVVGRQDGYILLYELNGKLLAERSFDCNARIVDVEWLSISSMPVSTVDLRDQEASSIRMAFAGAYALAESVDAKATSVSCALAGADHSTETTHLRESLPRSSRVQQSPRLSMLPPRRLLPSEIPPRPAPRKDEKLALRRAETSHAITPSSLSTTRLTEAKHKTIAAPLKTGSQPSRSGQDIPRGGDWTISLENDQYNTYEHEILGKGSIETSNKSGSKIGHIPLRKMSSIPSRLGSKNKTSKSHEVSSSASTETSNDTIITRTGPLIRRQTLPLKSSTAVEKVQKAHPLGAKLQSMASGDNLNDQKSSTRSQRQSEIHEDVPDATTTVTPSAHQRSKVAFRRASTMVNALGNGSLNPVLNHLTPAKEPADLKTKASHRASRQRVESSPCAESPSPQTLVKSEVASIQALLVEKLIVMERKIIMHSDKQREILEREIAEQFEVQKRWYLKATQVQVDRATKYEQENGFLRDRFNQEKKRRVG